MPLPGEGLYPLRTLACTLLIFAVATLAHGSGFLAVFAAGIALGDGRAPFKGEIERFHTALASLAEIVAFIALGLTVDLSVIARADVWVPGLILGAALAFAIRPALAGLSLVPARLKPGERAFVLFAGLKGAVPVLLGIFLLETRLPGCRAPVRHHRGGRGVLRRRPGQPGAGRCPAAAGADAPSTRSPGRWACGCRTSPAACTTSPSGKARPPTAAPSAR